MAWFRPIRNHKTDEHMIGLSIVLAIFVFPAYLVIVALQNPMGGNDDIVGIILNLVIVAFFWPALLCTMPAENWNRGARVGNSKV